MKRCIQVKHYRCYLLLEDRYADRLSVDVTAKHGYHIEPNPGARGIKEAMGVLQRHVNRRHRGVALLCPKEVTWLG